MGTSPSNHIESLLLGLQAPKTDWQKLLGQILEHFDCSTGTLHFLDAESKLLHVAAHSGVPDFLVPKLAVIPVGKGMAGIAAQRREPVQLCNLQTDSSGVARPAAKETKVEGSLAVPMLHDGKLYGVLGIGKQVPYDFTQEETRALLSVGEAIAKQHGQS
ncbi:GAF domain-containing protein [Maribacter sp. 2307ULW6-5]|uniref:GAF domain-containing protein n=1 Tax=Maribacter sp. 2307ULW6-5 TaxID=3386275 RepID=UPI0039BC7DEB